MNHEKDCGHFQMKPCDCGTRIPEKDTSTKEHEHVYPALGPCMICGEFRPGDTPTDWEARLEDFAVINELYLRGAPMGKIKAFIAQERKEAYEQGRSKGMEEEAIGCHEHCEAARLEGRKEAKSEYQDALEFMKEAERKLREQSVQDAKTAVVEFIKAHHPSSEYATVARFKGENTPRSLMRLVSDNTLEAALTDT